MKFVLPLFLLEGISAGEIIIIFLIVLLFFGSKSIPKMARTFGRGMRQIRDASHQIQEDIKNAVVDEIPRTNLKKEEPLKMLVSVLLLFLGLALLIAGGEFLVNSAISISKRLNVPPLLIGVTVVSFGTSAPELMVSLQAAINNSAGIAIGNVLGSNIANIGLVLGFTVLIKPILFQRKKYIIPWAVMFVSSLLFLLFCLDNKIDFFNGLIFVLGLLVFIFLSIKFIVSEDLNSDEKENTQYPGIFKTILLFLLGAMGLYFGSEFFVQNAVVIAKALNVPQFIIGITIVALGTSLPELVTSLVAAVRNHNSISIGNLIGSNIFNVFAVLGITFSSIFRDKKDNNN